MQPAIGNILCVALGGACGSALRYAISIFINERAGAGFPWGTLAVNVTGCALLGLLCGIADRGGLQMSPQLRLLLTVGFCGGFTTFSTFANEGVMLLSAGRLAAAAGYAAVSLTLGFTALFAAQRLAATL